MKIKVCGLKQPENIKAVAALNPDYMGFICYEPSPRFITALSPETLDAFPETIYKTAVFVDESVENIKNLISTFDFNAIQLHGNEGPEFSRSLRNKATVFKAFGIDENFDFSQLETYAGSVDYFIFDTKTEGYGGSGRAFNWELLQRYHYQVPFFLSGGISLDNLDDLTTIDHPQFYGVDLNSRFEISPGIKDIEKLKKAFEIIKK